MAVTGTEQRIYGTLTGNCKIDLSRFAIVQNNLTESPTTATTVYYGNNFPYKQFGLNYDGYITLYMSQSDLSTIYIESRLCKKHANRLVIESYSLESISEDVGVWFATSLNDNSWMQINTVSGGNVMEFASVSLQSRFSSNLSSLISLDCCPTCMDCKCASCSGVLRLIKIIITRLTYTYSSFSSIKIGTNTITHYGWNSGSGSEQCDTLTYKDYGFEFSQFKLSYTIKPSMNGLSNISLNFYRQEKEYVEKSDTLYSNEYIEIYYLRHEYTKLYTNPESPCGYTNIPEVENNYWELIYEGFSYDI